METALLTLTASPDGATLFAAGDLDLTTKPFFGAALTALLREGFPRPADVPHLDLTALVFLDSAGLEALVSAHRCLAERGDRLHIRARLGTQPVRVLKVGLFGKLFRLEFAEKNDLGSR